MLKRAEGQAGAALQRLLRLRQEADALPLAQRRLFANELDASLAELQLLKDELAVGAPLSSAIDSANFLRLLIRSSVDGILAFDRQCCYTVWNPVMEQMSGLGQDEVLGKCAFDVFPFLKETGEDIAIRETLAGKSVERTDRPYHVPATGRAGFFEAHYAPLRSSLGEVVGGLVIVRDITERKATEERMVQAERLAAVGQMISGLAHEARNALQRSQACLDVLSLKIGDRPEVADLIGRIQLAQDRLRDLYEEVRDYAAPIRLQPQFCRLSDLLHEAWNQLRHLQTPKNAQLIEGDDGDLRCWVDPHAMKRVFRNIFENSLMAAPSPAEVSVAWSASAEEARFVAAVVLSDNGPGLTADPSERIFEPFYTTKSKGAGLGLAVAKRIVEAHGGRIRAGRCERGAAISIDLPRGAYEPIIADRDRR